MSTGICRSPDSRHWIELYKAALSEISVPGPGKVSQKGCSNVCAGSPPRLS